MANFSNTWRASKKPRKQRAWRVKAPLHIRKKLMKVHLAKDLRKRYHMRSILLRKGDKVKVLRGQKKNHVGDVDRLNLKTGSVFLTGMEITKKDGSKTTPHLNPTNLIITELNLDDKKRQKTLERAVAND